MRASVIDYNTAEEVGQMASRELVIESLLVERTGTGAVVAFKDETGVWQFCPPERAEQYKRWGFEVRTVYITEER
jgi:hypothetical protein